MSGDVLGIDLGTTYSCAAVYKKGKGPVIIPNDLGERITASVVYYDPTNGDVCIGKDAIDEIPAWPSNGLYDAKRIIGRKFDDEYVSKFTTTNSVPFSIVRADNDQAAFQIEINGDTVLKTPQEVSAQVLKYLKESSEKFVGGDITEAVISVPAYFSNAQRKATIEAANLAGLKVLKLINEPTAAAIHYVNDKKRENMQILVFDFGGGTLDVSIIKVNGYKFEVKAVYGDTFLGGRDIDEILYKHFRKTYPPPENVRETIKKTYLRRLKTASVEIKKKLSAIEFAKYSIPSCYGGAEEIELTLSRDEFVTLTDEIFKSAIDVVDLALDDSGISKTDIDQVVLVGGSSKIPTIRDILRTYFDDDNSTSTRKIMTDIHPDEAVAAGASIQASLLKYKFPELENYKITEVTPLSLGIQSDFNLMGVFIPRNTQIPHKVTKQFVTCDNYQRNIAIKVFEGERKNTEYNNLLAEFKITELPRRRAGDVKINVTFELDEDGILNVIAEEGITGKTNKLVVMIGQFRLSERKIRHSVEEAHNNKEADDIFEQFILYKSNVEMKCKHIIYDLDEISSVESRTLVEQKCRKLLNFCVGLDSIDITLVENKFTEFKASVENILLEYDMQLL